MVFYFSSILFVYLCIIHFAYSPKFESKKPVDVVKKHAEQIAPYIIMDIKREELLKVIYEDYEKKNLKPKARLQLYEYLDAPKVEWKADPKLHYTLCMIVPDIAKFDETVHDWKMFLYLHWLIVNIPGNNIDKGTVLASYEPSMQNNLTLTTVSSSCVDLYQYVFLLYKQTNGILNESQYAYNEFETRWNFPITEFSRKYNLGDPIAKNVFLDTLHIQPY